MERKNEQSLVEAVKVVPYQNLPINDDQEAKWSFTAAEGNAILGDPPNWDRYKKAHILFDPENAEKRAGYKLPIAKLVSGQLKVFWRGVSAAMGVLMGARGGIKGLPGDVKRKAYNHLAKYYKKFDKEPPEFREEKEEVAAEAVKPFKESISSAAGEYDAAKKTWRILAIEAGCGLNRCYPPEVLSKMAPAFMGLPVYDGHAFEHSPKDLVGYIDNPRFGTERLPSGEEKTGIFADLHLTNPVRAAECQDAMYRKLVSFSITAQGETQVQDVGGQPGEVVLQFSPLSVDMVFEPAQGGQFVESKNIAKEKMMQEMVERVTRLEAVNRELLARQMADKHVSSLTELPEVTRKRIVESVVAAARQCSKEKIETLIESAVKSEKEYLDSLHVDTKVSAGAPDENVKRLDEAILSEHKRLRADLFRSFGLVEGAESKEVH